MAERADIVDALVEAQRALNALYGELSEGDLARPCTESEMKDGSPWSAKDHLSHLAMVERVYQGAARRALGGEADPLGLLARPRREITRDLHLWNEAAVDEARREPVESLLVDVGAARRETLSLVTELSDQQLGMTLRSPWPDDTVGGILMAIVWHAQEHMRWVLDGLEGRRPD